MAFTDLTEQEPQLKDIIALLPPAWQAEVFRAPDSWLAEAAGFDDSAVRQYRLKHGIPRANGPGGAPRTGKPDWVRTVREIIRRMLAGEPFPEPSEIRGTLDP